jgi:hypothetical protein
MKRVDVNASTAPSVRPAFIMHYIRLHHWAFVNQVHEDFVQSSIISKQRYAYDNCGGG